MSKEVKNTLQEDYENYMKTHQISELFEKLTEELVKNKPQNLFGFLVHQLEEHAKKMKLERKVVFVLGGPGSGKGTQCQKLIERGGFKHFSAGDLLRAAAKEESELGEMIRGHLKEGTLVPGHVTIGLLRKEIEKTDKDTVVLVDGFPREMKQCLDFERDCCEGMFCLYYTCSEETLKKRILKRAEESEVKRTDDNMDTLIRRFNTFKRQSFPVIQYFRATDRVREISGEDDIDMVFKNTLGVFEK